MVEHIAEFVMFVMGILGYPGLVLMMALESMIAPVPSEIVMPFAGFLIAQGKFTILGGIVASSLGTITGSIIGYYMGKFGGYPLVMRFGRLIDALARRLRTAEEDPVGHHRARSYFWARRTKSLR